MRISVSTKLYPVEAVLAASHAFLDRAYIFLACSRAGDCVEVRLKIKKGPRAGSVGDIRDEFLNELIYATLRQKISRENRTLREFIVGRALFSVSPVPAAEGAGDSDYKEDPLGIAIPWEEKHGKKSGKGRGKGPLRS